MGCSLSGKLLIEFFIQITYFYVISTQAILGIIFVYRELGVSALAGAAVLAILVPVNAVGSKMGEIIQRKQLKAKDSRIKVLIDLSYYDYHLLIILSNS